MLREGSPEYERRANRLARCYVHIHQCKKCGNPCADGYCCGSCGDANPNWSKAEEAAWEAKYATKANVK